MEKRELTDVEVCVLFGERVKAARTLRGWSQHSLSYASRVSQKEISQYENGKRRASIVSTRKLCLALEVSADSLLGLDREPRR